LLSSYEGDELPGREQCGGDGVGDGDHG